jgi:F-type H+-transporting ATPase subunit gamma
MTETLPILRRKIKGAQDLQSVVRTMKAMAGAAIGPYERAVEALSEYSRSVELALVAFFRHWPELPPAHGPKGARKIGAIMFGTDQGMVGQFNERLVDFASRMLPSRSVVWVVGERLRCRIQDAGFQIAGSFSTPNAVAGITPLVCELLLAVEQQRQLGALDEVRLVYNQPRHRATYDPVTKRLLPLDEEWRREMESVRWPTRAVPQLICGDETAITTFVREFLFVSIFRACAESLAAENARRFVAMQGAEKNIKELLSNLTQTYHHRRQAAIDEELFDLVATYARDSRGDERSS